jgi:G:T-mismatch repair DNA endonuclease (very short patch repair protein)
MPNGPRRRPYVTPDFVFSKGRLAVFIDGCFWHACPEHATYPATRADFWTTKLNANKARDRYVSLALRRQGWHVIRIWEHELRLGAIIARRVMAATTCAARGRGDSNRTVQRKSPVNERALQISRSREYRRS